MWQNGFFVDFYIGYFGIAFFGKSSYRDSYWNHRDCFSNKKLFGHKNM